jgi:hypothetical protein
VVFYVGKKTDTGSPVEKAGLTNGTLYALSVAGTLQEPAAGFPPATPFTLAALSNQEGKSMASWTRSACRWAAPPSTAPRTAPGIPHARATTTS